jgi:hypothetical protein
MPSKVCVFPKLPLAPNQFETRTFRYGDEVCIRDYEYATRGRYFRPNRDAQGHAITHIVDNRWFAWYTIGKLIPTPVVSPTAVEVVGRNVEVKIPTKQNLGRGVVQTTETTRQLPEDVERLLKTYGGKTHRSRGRRRKTRRRRSTRKYARSL